MYSGDTFLQHYLGAIQAAMVGETLTTISPVLGDLNFDGAVTTSDIQAMLTALTNLSVFKSQHGLSDGYLLDIADLNGDGAVTNADIAGLLAHFTAVAGAGSILAGPQAVPEPAAWVLAIAGLAAVLLLCRKGSGAVSAEAVCIEKAHIGNDSRTPSNSPSFNAKFVAPSHNSRLHSANLSE
jgi:hypothetical protein